MRVSSKDLLADTFYGGHWPAIKGCEEEIESWEEFNAQLKARYTDDMFRRDNLKGVRIWDRPRNKLLFDIYTYISDRINGDHRAEFTKIINSYADKFYPYDQISGINRKFAIVVYLLQASVGYLEHKKHRSYLASQMRHAHRHRIHPKMIVGFTKQCGGAAAVVKRVQSEGMESWWGES